MPVQFHEDAVLFREGLEYTESLTGLSARLIEKDYYCSLILRDWARMFMLGLVFKGGTCLSKVYVGFYRLSEDLDFAIPTEINALRSVRRAMAAPVKEHFSSLPDRLSCFEIGDGFRGHNSSRQYIGKYRYCSVVTERDATIKVEASLREPIVGSLEERAAGTILINPLTGDGAIEPVPVKVMSLLESYAEKLRAALTRMEPAIRDFYDIDHAIRGGHIDPRSKVLLELLRKKLTIPGNQTIDVSTSRLKKLQAQLEAQLKPVLRMADYNAFALGSAYDMVCAIASVV